jgi:hypothetical protein
MRPETESEKQSHRWLGQVFVALALISGLLLPASLRAQTTTVSGTVTDPNGVPYGAGAAITANCQGGCSTVTITSQAQCAAGGFGSAPCNVPFPGTVGPTQLSSTGSFSVTLYSNTSINPGGSQWQFTVNISPGVVPPWGTGPQTFSVLVTVTGATQSITSTLDAAAPALTQTFSSGGGVTGCNTTGGVLFQNGTPNIGTCSPNMVYDPVAGELQVACDPNVNTDGCVLVGIDGTVTGTTGVDEFAFQANVNVDIESPNSTTTAFFGNFSGIGATGSGSFLGDMVGIAAGNTFTGTGTSVDSIGFQADTPGLSGGFTITGANYGFKSADQSDIAPVNYDYYAPATSAGNNWQYFAAKGGTSQLDLLQLTNSLCLEGSASGSSCFSTLPGGATIVFNGNFAPNGGIVLLSSTSPSIVAAGCGGAGASISANGSGAFTVNVGTSNTGTCTITMPTASDNWGCGATDITTTSANVFLTKSSPTSGHAATEITLQNYTDAGATHAWTDSDKIQVQCGGQ